MKSVAALAKDWLIKRGNIPDSFTTDDIYKALKPFHSHATRAAISGYLTRMVWAGALKAVKVGRGHSFTILDFSILEGSLTKSAPVPYERSRTCLNEYQSHASPVNRMMTAPPPGPFISFPSVAPATQSVSEPVPVPITVQSLQDRLMAVAADLEKISTPLSSFPTQALLDELALRVH